MSGYLRRSLCLALSVGPLVAQIRSLEVGRSTIQAPGRGSFQAQSYRGITVQYQSMSQKPSSLRGAWVLGVTSLSGAASWSESGPGMWDGGGGRYQPSRVWHVGGRWVTSGRIQVAWGGDARLLAFRAEGHSGDIGNGVTDTRLTPWAVIQVRVGLGQGAHLGIQAGQTLAIGPLGGGSARPHPDRELLATVGFTL